MHWVKHAPQGFLVDLLIDRLALWQELAGDDAPHIKECDKYNWLLLSLAIWVMLKNPCLITSDEFEARLIQFECALGCPDTAACSTPFWSSFSILNAISTQTFRMLISSEIIFQTLFHVQLTCDDSNSQPTYTTHDQVYPLDIDLSPACWWPSVPGVIFHYLALWTSWTIQKLVRVT